MSERAQPGRIAYRLSQLGAVATRQFAGLVKDLDLTPPEAGVLRLISHSPGIGQRDLAERLGAAPSRVVALLDQLQAKELVDRRRSETDRRSHQLVLTDSGEEMMQRLTAVSATHGARTLAPLSQPERRQLGALLDKLATAHGIEPAVHPGYRTGTPPRVEPEDG